MEKREFNKIIKQQLLSYGFAKIGTYDYVKEAQDGKTKLIVRAPDQTYGFSVGAQFVDFLTEYADYSGKFNKSCMYYPVGALLQFAGRRDYSESEIVGAVKAVIEKIDIFLKNGQNAILDNINDWFFGVENESRKNGIYAYFDLPLIDPYSKEYQDKRASQMSGGGMSILPLTEYLQHKDFYDAYKDYDSFDAEICVNEEKNEVVIHFHSKPKHY